MIQRLKLVELNDAINFNIDLFVCCSSFESRCLSIAENIDSEKITRALICENEDFHFYATNNTKKLLSIFNEKGNIVKLNTKNPIMVVNNLWEQIKNYVELKEQTILIDSTTFTHEELLILFRIIDKLTNLNNRVIFLYSTAKEYSVGDSQEDKWLSRGIQNVRSVLGFPGQLLPSKHTHLIVLVGFEATRAAKIIDSYDNATVSIGFVPENQATLKLHYKANLLFFDYLAMAYPKLNKFEFSGIDPEQTKTDLLNQIALFSDHNTVIVPMNTKLSTIGVGMLASEINQIQLCYAPAKIYNYKNYSIPNDDLYLYQLR